MLPMQQQVWIAFAIACTAYAVVLSFWLWASIAYIIYFHKLPSTRERCNTLSKILLNKMLLAALASGPAAALFNLVKR
jgi:hypothetical protein